MFDHEITNRIAAVARESEIEPISLLAVAEVESGGIATVLVNGRQEPLIRFEGHYFDRRLSAGKQRTAAARDFRARSPAPCTIRRRRRHVGRFCNTQRQSTTRPPTNRPRGASVR